MGSAPATAEQLAPSARPSLNGAAEVTVIYYKADVMVSRTLAGGWAQTSHVQCEHMHTTRAQADACAVRLARREQTKTRAEFQPCDCHGATPSTYCAEHPEPIRFYVAD